ncbi:4-hydroxy-3-methylbut-2-enyl diphosphate reductase [Roseimicrobium gellanilyticum]|uniref:4-hydroxy-3-methylbut-2-enyl diphosphate reductase n=1 Tax=Roseimicrobium gellanilyticum TaxID=748857 RepID=A0A366HR60_9BACT|nr:4-hydroxy-3-methylbut-2-enyl diphosphate reductase [Roseimicrobium gellanilyticum]RBP45022.1 4-hydroxy-3-methylbut-2-enyl diphosphate reductase [Roseimicrobium gellanilyticum]
MTIQLAKHHGMCFGVRDALRATHTAARSGPVTILGQLVHNPLVDSHLRTLGVEIGTLSDTPSAPTPGVVITAHGASDNQRAAWVGAGYRVTDTTCPLVRKAHDALGALVREGYFPVVIGQASHVEVRGLTGDFPEAIVLLVEEETAEVPFRPKFGVISQTTQPITHVLQVVDALKRRHPGAEVRFVDTVCNPTKQRQSALVELCADCDTVVVIGGRNSNNTRQLVESARRLGCIAHQVERAEDLDPAWFEKAQHVGVTAGTSTLDETVRAVMDRLQVIAAEQNSGSGSQLAGLLKLALGQGTATPLS